MSLRPYRSLLGAVTFAAILAAGPACSDDDPTGNDATIVGSWTATSFQALGMDFIADGMTVDATLTDAGTYTLEVTGDLVGVCEGSPECERDGSYTSTSSQITLDPGLETEVTFGYTVTTATMTWSGTIEGFPVTITFDRT